MKKIMLLNSLLIALILVAPTFAQSETESTYVMMHGYVNYYGTKPAFGWCGAYAKIGEWAQVFIGWTLALPQIPGGTEEPPIANITYSFYAARLMNATSAELNYSGNDLYISGLWDVYNVTFAYDGVGNFNFTRESIVDHGNGMLYVTGNWTEFTVEITGIPMLKGTVMHNCSHSTGPIPIGDVSCPSNPGVPDNNINIYDLVHEAKAFGSMPGMMHYDFSIDFNFDFTIDICDLTTIAVNIGESY